MNTSTIEAAVELSLRVCNDPEVPVDAFVYIFRQVTRSELEEVFEFEKSILSAEIEALPDFETYLIWLGLQELL